MLKITNPSAQFEENLINKTNTDKNNHEHQLDKSLNNTILSSKEISAGKHLIIDFWGAKSLCDEQLIESALKSAVTAAGAILLHIHLHTFSGEGGVTGVALLAESHISVHTWPEYNYAAFDVFMCGDCEPEKAVNILKQIFAPEKVEVTQLLRGKLANHFRPDEPFN